MHPTCVGLDGIPDGRWFCPEHEHLAAAKKPRKEAKGPAKAAKGGSAKGEGKGKARGQHKSGGKGGKKRVLQKGAALLVSYSLEQPTRMIGDVHAG